MPSWRLTDRRIDDTTNLAISPAVATPAGRITPPDGDPTCRVGSAAPRRTTPGRRRWRDRRRRTLPRFRAGRERAADVAWTFRAGRAGVADRHRALPSGTSR